MPSWSDDLTEEEVDALGRGSLRIAVALTVLVGLLVILALAVGLSAAHAEDEPGGISTALVVDAAGHEKEFGYGMVSFGGRGPEAWRWQLVLEKRRAAKLQRRLTVRVLQVRELRRAARRQLVYPTGHWLDGAFLCIHRYERNPTQGWRTLTGNGFHGGLQMDSSFQRTYGPEWARKAFGESAHLWPASVQIAAAIQAWTSRGFGPWPNTRKSCGL